VTPGDCDGAAGGRDNPCGGAGGSKGSESQNGQGWKGPLWVTQPNPLPKQGHPQQAAQHRVQVGLEYLQRRKLHSLPGQPVPGLHHPQSEITPDGDAETGSLQAGAFLISFSAKHSPMCQPGLRKPRETG